MAESSSKQQGQAAGGAVYLNKAGLAKVLGIDGAAATRLPDLPPADEWMEGGGSSLTPLWRRDTVLAYAESAAYLERKRFTPAKYR